MRSMCLMVVVCGLLSGPVSRVCKYSVDTVSRPLTPCFTEGANWPAGGEIDILEGVNQQIGNQVAVHASGQ